MDKLLGLLSLVIIAAIGAVATPLAASAQTPGGGSAGRGHGPMCMASGASLATPGAALPHAPQAPNAAPASFQLVADAPVPGGASRFDYQSLDPTTGRLYIAHMGADQIVVFDTRSDQVVGTVDGVKTPTGVLIVPELGRLFAAAAGSHDVAVIGAASRNVVAHVGQIGFPDGLAYAPQSNQVFVSDESGGGETVIDAKSTRVATTIDIGGEAGNTQFDPGSGCVLVAVQNRDQLVAIDPRADRLIGRYELDRDCQGPHGFLVDAPRRLAFVSCEDNAKLLVVDLTTMRVIGTDAVGDKPDVLAFDPGWRRLYVAAESGVVSIFDERDGGLQAAGKHRAPHAHSVAVDPGTHRVYLPLENVDGRPVLRILAPCPPVAAP